MSNYEFTKDWFSWAPEVWEKLIPLLPARQRFLEIGSFEGRSAVWIMENMMEDGGYIDCIDTWEGGEEHSAEDMAAVEERFDNNLEIACEKFGEFDGEEARNYFKIKAPSVRALGALLLDQEFINDFPMGGPGKPVKPKYDFIYIDGSHIAKDVLTDACMAWPMLKKGGIMVFDDYLWGEPRDILHRPKIAVDAFVNAFAEEIDIVHVGYQLIVRKKEGAN